MQGSNLRLLPCEGSVSVLADTTDTRTYWLNSVFEPSFEGVSADKTVMFRMT
jgi:hypothetical protein